MTPTTLTACVREPTSKGRADRFRFRELSVVDDALRWGSTASDREGGRYPGIPSAATVDSAPQSPQRVCE
jgi:hypothetical protein